MLRRRPLSSACQHPLQATCYAQAWSLRLCEAHACIGCLSMATGDAVIDRMADQFALLLGSASWPAGASQRAR